MDLGASRLQALRLVTLPVMHPCHHLRRDPDLHHRVRRLRAGVLHERVDPQPLSVRIYSAIRFGIQPSINAVGTLMLVGSLVLIAIALTRPALLR